MSQEKTHDLYGFMRQLSDEIAAEYDRIQKRTTEDPGTAGDQGEENWAELLRGWLQWSGFFSHYKDEHHKYARNSRNLHEPKPA